MKIWSTALHLSPAFSLAYYSRDYVYATQNKFEHAILDYNKVIELVPNFAPAFFTSGVVYSITGDMAQAISIDAEYALAYFNRGLAYAELEEQEKAIADLEKALEHGLDPRTEQSAKKLLGELRE